MIDMSHQKKFLKNRIRPIHLPPEDQGFALLDSGFTLLEVVIALAILVMAFASILAVEGGSVNASVKAKQMNIVAMLAKNKMVETEFTFEGKPFDEVKKETEGTFEEPYQDYRWKTKIQELKFPALSTSGGKAGGTEGGGTSSAGGQNQGADLIMKMMSNFLSKAIREVNVTVFWKKGTIEQNFTLSTFWVDLSYEFKLSE